MNAGILLINLDEWRKSGLGRRVVNFLAEHRLKFPDQDSLNRHIGGNFIPLDARWNAQAPCAKRRAGFLPKLLREKKTDWAAKSRKIISPSGKRPVSKNSRYRRAG